MCKIYYYYCEETQEYIEHPIDSDKNVDEYDELLQEFIKLIKEQK